MLMYTLLLIKERKTNSWEEGGVLTYKGKELSGTKRGKKSRGNEEEKSGHIQNERLQVSNHLDTKEKGQ